MHLKSISWTKTPRLYNHVGPIHVFCLHLIYCFPLQSVIHLICASASSCLNSHFSE